MGVGREEWGERLYLNSEKKGDKITIFSYKRGWLSDINFTTGNL